MCVKITENKEVQWDLVQIKIEHEEMIRQAEQEKLAQEALDDLHPNVKSYNPALAWVGRRMVEIGSKLVALSEPEAPLN